MRIAERKGLPPHQNGHHRAPDHARLVWGFTHQNGHHRAPDHARLVWGFTHQNGHHRAPDHARLVWGFTLIEIVIVLAVTSMLTGVMILYGSSGRRLVLLSVDSAKLAQVIMRAKSRATAAEYDASDPACGYGVRADYAAKKRYALFRYQPSQGEGCGAVGAIGPENYDELETFSLSSGVSFKETIESAKDVLFIPPDPRTLLFRVDGVRVSGSRAFILGTDDGLSEHSIGVTSGGQISF